MVSTTSIGSGAFTGPVASACDPGVTPLGLRVRAGCAAAEADAPDAGVAAGVARACATGKTIRFFVSSVLSCAVAAPAAKSSKIKIGRMQMNGPLFPARRKLRHAPGRSIFFPVTWQPEIPLGTLRMARQLRRLRVNPFASCLDVELAREDGIWKDFFHVHRSRISQKVSPDL